MTVSGSTAAVIAVAAGAAALLALALALATWLRLRRLREAQQALLGGGRGDVVQFVVGLQGRIDELHRSVDDLAGALAGLAGRVERVVSKVAVVRYDAYENTGGHQSASVALLDDSRTGIVLTAIQGRDYARIYTKELEHGNASVALSPEELEAVERAMAR
jgi:hypothetical protein